MKRAVLASLLLLLVAATGLSATYHVPGEFPAIQSALAHSSVFSGDTILVDPGTYMENISFLGKDLILMSQAGPEATVIDGGQVGSVAIFTNGETPAAVLDGFTLRNGNSLGGAVFCCMSSPVIVRNVIRYNFGEAAAGGICSKNHSAPLIAENVITQNRCTIYFGGGILCATSAPTIRDNLITKNTAVQGGGICCQYLPAAVTGNVISENTAAGEGGGVCCLESGSILENNIIVKNKAGSGGGIYCHVSSPLVTNNTIADNESALPGGGIAAEAGGFPSVQNTIVWGNAPDAISGISMVLFCIVEGNYFGPCNLDADPQFIDPLAGDYHIAHHSPGRDKGNNGAPPLPDSDFEGDPRISGGVVDIGADEFHVHLYCRGECAPGGNIAVKMVGEPGASPVYLWLGSGVLEEALSTSFGDWWLKSPLLLQLIFGPVPSPQGVVELPLALPPDLPAPLDIPLQGLVGKNLTNLCLLEIRDG